LWTRPLTKRVAELYARLNEKDAAFEWLERAYLEHSDGLVRLKEEVGFDNVRSDPRLQICCGVSVCHSD
jgi:hypothetical protein